MQNKEEIFDSLKLIKSNKLNSSQTIEYFSGFTYKILLDKDIFPNNDDLKEFIMSVYLKRIKADQFKDYVYRSRTLLASRLVRKILENYNFNITLEASDQLMSIFNNIYHFEENKESKHRTKQSTIDDSLVSWMNKIRQGFDN